MGYQLPPMNELIDTIRQESEKALKKKVEQVENTYLAIQLLAGEGVYVQPVVTAFGYTYEMEVTAKELAGVRRALGRLNIWSRDPVEKKRNKLWVKLSPVDRKFSHLNFKYMAKVKAGGRCKIKTVRKTYRTLVCE